MKTLRFTIRDAAGQPLVEKQFGHVHFLFGILVAACRGRTWEVYEPTTGRLVSTGYYRTQTGAVNAAGEAIERHGGAMAMASNMAGNAPCLSGRQVHAAEFQYGAGGPLDAPDRLPLGGSRASPYGTAATAPRAPPNIVTTMSCPRTGPP